MGSRSVPLARERSGWRQPLWLALLVGASVAFSLGFACVTPFAAFAAAAALTLPRRDGLVLIGAVWLANQIVGYGFLAYPWTVDSFAWGIALGLAGLLATLGARGAARATAGAVRPLAAFIAAAAIFEGALFVVAATLLGGTASFAPAIVGQVVALDAAAFAGLIAINRIGLLIGLASPPALALRLPAAHA